MYQLLQMLVVGYIACFKGDAHKEETGFKFFVSCILKLQLHEIFDFIPDMIKVKYVH